MNVLNYYKKFPRTRPARLPLAAEKLQKMKTLYQIVVKRKQVVFNNQSVTFLDKTLHLFNHVSFLPAVLVMYL